VDGDGERLAGDGPPGEAVALVGRDLSQVGEGDAVPRGDEGQRGGVIGSLDALRAAVGVLEGERGGRS
jgi:hypothetical protein